ncbi:MAG: VCBS repeat-containing protein [Gammaproteobacteria bacterium]|nr:VCBS repeat-containing protein [Gammaproteobacteria bacterium]MDE0648902.1 VCBS repeat-containing protein [Gammaproteobacteria bacterium]MXW09002.1 CRTAC1 family protein [Gammaproteobacteria bacterium]MYC53595.1 CRTAC1 family protein [Gammaproteobacteria bacterium]
MPRIRAIRTARTALSMAGGGARTARWVASLLLALGAACVGPRPDVTPVAFDRVQPELFETPGAQTNSWVDYDGDGDLDLFVGMRYTPNRLYRNDGGHLVNVAAEVGLADLEDTRAGAWGDYDGDGDPDLYVGYPVAEGTPNRLYRNDGGRFTDVAPGLGVDLVGTSRQPSWIDYDGDGDLDLFVALRDQPNRMFRNDGAQGESGAPEDSGGASAAGDALAWTFTDVTAESGLGDPRRTVGVAWFDYDRDGDLDVHVSNQNGDEDAFYRNEGDGTFVDVAPALGMNHPGRGAEYGSVAATVTDFDNDGDLDLFVATYGPDILWSNNGDGTFTDVTDPATLGVDYHSTSAVWGDVDHNGLPDLVVTSYLSGIAAVEDHLFMNAGGGRFHNALPANLLEHGPSHGVAWADFDGDGDLDLSIANNDEIGGTHHLYRNLLAPDAAARSLQVAAVDATGRSVVPGAEVQLLDHDTGALLGTRLIDTGGGYCSQGAAPAHFGLPPGVERVDVRVTFIAGGERSIVVREGVPPADYDGRWLIVSRGG